MTSTSPAAMFAALSPVPNPAATEEIAQIAGQAAIRRAASLAVTWPPLATGDLLRLVALSRSRENLTTMQLSELAARVAAGEIVVNVHRDAGSAAWTLTSVRAVRA